jgi:hypothetical protein
MNRRTVWSVLAVAGLTWTAACGSSATTTLTTAPSVVSAGAGSAGDATRVAFASLTTDGAAVASYTESGFRVSMTSGDWRARATYGNPAPFIQFWAEAGTTTAGEIQVAPLAPMYFKSVDLYASTTPIPYVIKGSRNGAVVFTLTGTVPNTFGSFRTVLNTNPVTVDSVSIALMNTAAACCRNPMGLDNVTFSDTPTTPPTLYALSGTVTDSESGAAVSGAKVSISAGVDKGLSTTTSASGAFSLTGLSEGAVTVSATATSYLSGAQTTYLDANQSVTLRLARDPRVQTYPTPPAGATVLGLSGLGANGAAVSTYTESGFTIAASTPNWTVSTGYGHPAPFMQFVAEASTTATGRMELSAGGSPFSFVSVELYSSTTRIPYTITGVRNGTTVFTLSDELPNTFGNFRSVVNPQSATPVDKVLITLTNNAAVRNPMGLDTIVVVR